MSQTVLLDMSGKDGTNYCLAIKKYDCTASDKESKVPFWYKLLLYLNRFTIATGASQYSPLHTSLAPWESAAMGTTHILPSRNVAISINKLLANFHLSIHFHHIFFDYSQQHTVSCHFISMYMCRDCIETFWDTLVIVRLICLFHLSSHEMIYWNRLQANVKLCISKWSPFVIWGQGAIFI